MTAESARPSSWAGPVFWAVIGGLALGLALLSLGGLAFIAIPIVLLHQFYLSASLVITTALDSVLVARPAGKSRSGQWPAGASRRTGRGFALVCIDGEFTRLAGVGGVRYSP